jgi:hypothetical protein
MGWKGDYCRQWGEWWGYPDFRLDGQIQMKAGLNLESLYSGNRTRRLKVQIKIAFVMEPGCLLCVET